MSSRAARQRARASTLLALVLASVLGPVGSSSAGEPRASLPPPVGFAHEVRGGASAPDTWVRTLADGGPGSLRAAVARPGGAWVRFAVGGTIELERPLEIGSNVTLDGRDADVRITEHGLVVRGSDVVIHRLWFAEIGLGTDTEDAILLDGATGVWIDHCDFTAAGDKLVGAPRATDVTLSWNTFHDQEQAVEFGTFQTREVSHGLRATVHHNVFVRTGYRNPRVNYGTVHAFNNYVADWAQHGMSAARGAELLSEGNIFDAGEDKNAVITDRGKRTKDPRLGLVRSRGDVLLNGARVVQHEPGRVFDARRSYDYVAEAAAGPLRSRLLGSAGPAGSRLPAVSPTDEPATSSPPATPGPSSAPSPTVGSTAPEPSETSGPEGEALRVQEPGDDPAGGDGRGVAAVLAGLLAAVVTAGLLRRRSGARSAR